MNDAVAVVNPTGVGAITSRRILTLVEMMSLTNMDLGLLLSPSPALRRLLVLSPAA